MLFEKQCSLNANCHVLNEALPAVRTAFAG